MKNSSVLKAGEWVQVRSKDEILRTLDGRGHLEGLPFMPEMFEFCGQRFRVSKRAHKTCDPPNGLDGRRMPRAVHLEGVRCNGGAHGGCQAACLIFWKDAWLQKIGDVTSSDTRPTERRLCTEQNVQAGALNTANQADSDEPTYVCQSTQVAAATLPLRWWDARQYVEDYRSGNARLSQIFAAFLIFLHQQLATSGLGFGTPLRWTYDAVQRVRGGTPYPRRTGTVPKGTRTPSTRLDIQPGELVRVKTYNEILRTLDEDGFNRGMYFDAEMVPYCGGTYRVLDRVSTIVNEKTGKLQHFKNECLVLDDVTCRACYSKYRRFCPRSIYSFWREIWLERV